MGILEGWGMNKKRKLLNGIIQIGGLMPLSFLMLLGALMVFSRMLIIFHGGFCTDVAIRMMFGIVAVVGGWIGVRYWDKYWREKDE